MTAIDIIKYDQQFSVQPVGFINVGASCYFNTIIQSMLSCTSIINRLKNAKQLSELEKIYLDLYYTIKRNQPINNILLKLYNMLLQQSNDRRDLVKFTRGQQDAHELLLFLLDYMPNIERLFTHRYLIQIRCMNCQKIVSRRYQTNTTIEIETNINNTIDTTTSIKKLHHKIEDYKCDRCSVKGSSLSIATLTMVPEIIVIVFKKYQDKKNIPFDTTLYFPTANNTRKLKYELVAQCEHSGNMHGGHYYAVCKRQDGTFTLNDTHTSPSKFTSTPNTYMLFYHFIDTII